MDQLLETLKNLSPGRLFMLLGTFLLLVAFFLFITMRSQTPAMSLLYSELSATDSTEITAKLESANIPYALSEDGTRVSVAQKEVGRSRLLLAQEGLPRQGSMGYEIFDKKQSFGTTSFQQNINQLRALEGELARTISTIENIKNARVHLVLPQREMFSREQRPASASVFINLRNSAAIGSEQIQAIQHLIASSVPQLKSSSVAVIDQNGNLLARGEGDDNAMSARNTDEMKQKYEMRLNRSIEDMVGRIVGYGKVRATVTANLDFNVVSKNSESYNPDGQVVRSTQSITEEDVDNTGAANQAVSVENNLPGLPNTDAGASGVAGSKSNRSEEVTNYEISKTVETVMRESGEVQKLSVAVLVDGTYETDTAAVKPEDAPADWVAPTKYVPRTTEELAKIATLVKSAVGYDESRGDTVEVINMPFAESDFAEIAPAPTGVMDYFARPEVMSLAETLAFSLVAVLIVLLVLRPLVSHFASSLSVKNAGTDGMQADGSNLLSAPIGGQPQLTAAGSSGDSNESMIDMSSVEGKVKASSVQKISDLVTNHPAETVAVLRTWMAQEN